MPDDFATLYISDDLEHNHKINRREIYINLLNYFQSKGIKAETVVVTNKYGKSLKENYIDISINTNIHWRIILNEKKIGNLKKLFISFRPIFRNPSIYRYMKGYEVRAIATNDIETIKVKLGMSMQLSVGGKDINFYAFSYSNENKIDTNKWLVNFNQNAITYEDFSNNINMILNKIAEIKPFSFRVVDLTNTISDKNSSANLFIRKLEAYGSNVNENYNAYNYTSIPNSPNKNRNIINVILIRNSDNQFYMDSKEYFLNHGLPFQHIKIDGTILNGKVSSSYAFNMVLMEIYKKTQTHDLYLSPDHFVNEKIAGFIYIDADSILNESDRKYRKLFTVSYIMSENIDYMIETLTSTENINVFSGRNYFNIFDVEEAGKFIKKGNTTVSDNQMDPFYFNIVVTKEINRKSMMKLIDTLKNEGILINRVYYISTRMLGFADNFLYNTERELKIPYKVIGKNMAVIKVATEQSLYPQLFSTYVSILYPEDEDISENDIKNVVWLSKKRIYRVHSIKHITKIEPVSLKEKNITFLTSVQGSFNINYLI